MKKLIKKNFPSLVKWFNISKLSLKEKKLFPKYVKLDFSGNILYADPFEKRGRALLLNKGNGQPFIKKYWRTAINAFKPNTVLDVGANYGEVFLDTTYPDSLKTIIAVEANPFLYKYLEQSKHVHSASSKIILLNGLASDTNSQKNDFFIDKTSSGRSTSLKNNLVKEAIPVSVESYRIDDFMKNHNLTPSVLVFKIDVEGFESFVLEGMKNLMESEIDLIGCIEFNLTLLQKNNINVDTYLNFLNKYFEPIILLKNGELVDIPKLEKAVLKKLLPNKFTEGDILLFSKQELKTKFIASY